MLVAGAKSSVGDDAVPFGKVDLVVALVPLWMLVKVAKLVGLPVEKVTHVFNLAWDSLDQSTRI